METVLKFNSDERQLARRAFRADDAYGKLWDIDNTMRSIVKHGFMADATIFEVAEMVREIISEDHLMEDYY